MGEKPTPSSAGRQTGEEVKHDYSLFVSGTTRHSQRYVESVRSVCDRYIGRGYDLEIVDVFEYPDRAEAEQIYVTPTLIRYRPLPPRRIVGDFSSEAVLAAKMEFTG